MKPFAPLLGALILAGCAGAAGNDYSQYYQAVKQSLSGNFGTARITRDLVAAIPYASLSYRIKGSPEQMLILATDTNGNQLWTAGSHVVLQTRDGRITRSVGLPHDIANKTSANASPILPPSAAVTHPFTGAMVEDFPDIAAYGVRIICTTRPIALQTITIIGQAHRTYRVEEQCQAKALQWSFTDSYWIDPQTGFVWRSIQNLHPKGMPVGIQILRPPG